MIVFIAFLVLMFIVLGMITRWNAKKIKERESQTVYENLPFMARKEYRVKCKMVYGEYPEVNRFVNIKRKLLLFFVIFLVVIDVLKLYILVGSNVYPLDYVYMVIVYLFQFGVLGLALGSNWRMALMLYFWSLYCIVISGDSLYQNSISLNALQSSYEVSIRYTSGAALTGWLILAYGVLVLALAIWLTLVPKNRGLADLQGDLALSVRRGG